MNFRHRYKLTFEDETNLENKIKVSWKLPVYLLCIFGLLILILGTSIIILAFSPLRNTLPGYLKESERAATEEQHLRLDSVLLVYEINEAYLNNIYNVLEPVDYENPGIIDKKDATALTADSLLPVSKEEREFIEYIRERDKYNIASSTGAEKENMIFDFPHSSAIISEATKDSCTADIIIPHDGEVSAIAEGKVISISSSPWTSGGFEVIIQHPKGYLSKSGRLGNPMVRPGDHVSAGQIISSTSSVSGRRKDLITLELWHNGERLIPARYLKRN